MTVSYTSKVSRVRLLGFTRLLLLWRASIYKLLYREILIYCFLYAAISLVYRLALKEQQKKTFAAIVFYFGNFENLIPITFILGFYVTLVAQRWWNQYLNIPWPDRIIPYIANHVSGADERGRMIRRTLVRYLMISETLVFQSISPTVKVRFPTLDHVVEAGIMTKYEQKLYEGLPSQHHKYWVPCQWFSNLLNIARQEGRIVDDFGFNKIYEEMIKFKSALGTIYSYDWVSIPLVYTQVATISVYVFFLTSLITRQFIDLHLVKELTGEIKQAYMVDLYIPGFTLFQLFFYLGWLKVAEQMINPFGEDDDDFDVNYILDRNFQVGMMAVDQMYCQIPNLEKDRFWDETEPQLPYTLASQRYFQEETWMGSMAHINFPHTAAASFVPMESIAERTRNNNVVGRSDVPMEAHHVRSVFGSGSTFASPRKGRLGSKLFRNSRFDFLKSAPQINTNSLLDLEVKKDSMSPPIHISIPHEPFSCQPLLSTDRHGCVQIRPESSVIKAEVRPPTGNCRPPESDGSTEKLVEAWIQDEKNAFASKEALNAPLSNSTGHLAGAGGLPGSGVDAAAELPGVDQGPRPGAELKAEAAPNPSAATSLCDLRFTVEVVDAVPAPVPADPAPELARDERRVVFEADSQAHAGRACPGRGPPSADSTLDSTCPLIANEMPPAGSGPRPGSAHDAASVSDGSVGDSVRAVVNMGQACAGHAGCTEHAPWATRRESYQIAQEIY